MSLQFKKSSLELIASNVTEVVCRIEIGPIELFCSRSLKHISDAHNNTSSSPKELLTTNFTIKIHQVEMRVSHPSFSEDKFVVGFSKFVVAVGQLDSPSTGPVISLASFLEQFYTSVSLRHLDEILLFMHVWIDAANSKKTKTSSVFLTQNQPAQVVPG